VAPASWFRYCPAVDLDRRNQWLRGVLDLCVLALLRGGESYGYELAQRLEGQGIGPVQGGTLYPLLLRLQKTGLVETRWQQGEAGPPRKYYAITAAGRETLHRDGRDWRVFAGLVGAVMEEGTG
jgi:PadR family transcriptional regulator PadR